MNAHVSKKRAAVLTTLVRLRRQKANLARISLVAAQAVAAATRRRMDLLGDAMSRSNTVARDAISTGKHSPDMGVYRTRVAAIRRELSVCNLALTNDERVLATRRAELTDAVRRSRALQKAQQRLGVRESAALAGRQQKELEEVHAAHAACETVRARFLAVETV